MQSAPVILAWKLPSVAERSGLLFCNQDAAGG